MIRTHLKVAAISVLTLSFVVMATPANAAQEAEKKIPVSASSTEAASDQSTSGSRTSHAGSSLSKSASDSPVPTQSPVASVSARPNPLKTIFDRSAKEVEVVADSVEYQKDAKKVIARGNAVLTYKNMRVLADYAEVETATKKAYAKGHVFVFEDDEPTMKGEEIFYDFENHTGSFPNGRYISYPFFTKGQEIKEVSKGVISIKSGGATSCDRESPHYEFRCKKATVYTGVKIRMYSVTLHVLGKPVFWVPYMTLPLNWQIPFQANAGYKQRFGAYIELSKGITFNEHLSGKAHADWRARRGFGVGWDQNYDFKQYAKGDVKLYWTQDDMAPTPGAVNEDGELDPFGDTHKAKHGRGRITWRHRTDINENTNVILRYHRVADEYFMQEFMEEEFRDQMEPHSFVTATHNTERYGAMVHAEKRMNSFESLVERLPEVRLDWKNQPLLEEKIYNVSRLQFDNLYKVYSRQSGSNHTIRTDGYTRFVAPLKFNEIKLNPFVGYRGTQYSRDAFSSQGHYRQVLEYGADLRTQLYKTYNASFEKLGIEINQLRHVFEPNVRVQGMASSMQSIFRVYHNDTVDMIDSSSEIVFGMDNRLQTKRVVNGKIQRVDFVSFNTYLHYAVQPLNPTLSGAGFTLVEEELTLRPYEWMQIQHRLEYDFPDNNVRSWTDDILIRTGKWRFVFGHRYAEEYYNFMEDLIIPKSQQFVFDTKYQLNHLWELGGYIRWDTGGEGLQEWQVSASRDLHDFILDFGYNVRNSLINSNNNELFFRFRMKAYAPINFGVGGGRAEFGEPRIGETVQGANQTSHSGPWGHDSMIATEPYARP